MAELSQNQLSTPPPRMDWKVGTECVAQRDDGRWYRGKIVEVSDDLYRVAALSLLHGCLCFSTYIIS